MRPGDDPKPGRDRTQYPNPCPEDTTLVHDGRPDLPDTLTSVTEWDNLFGPKYRIEVQATPRYELIGAGLLKPKLGGVIDPEYNISVVEPIVVPGISRVHYLKGGPTNVKRAWTNNVRQERRPTRSLIGLLHNPTCGDMYVAVFQIVWDVKADVYVQPNMMHVGSRIGASGTGSATWLDSGGYLVWCAECPEKN
jgi:hypothetical protein